MQSNPAVLSPEDIINPKELAARLKVPESWVFEKTRKRQKNPLPAFRIGRYIRFSWSAVAAWLESTSPKPKGRLGRYPQQPGNPGPGQARSNRGCG